MNWRLKREGQFWARRYSEQIVQTEEDALEAFLYISTNPSRHGLLKNSFSWTGLTSIQQALSGKERQFSFTLFSGPDGEPVKQTHTLRLSPLPQHQGMSQSKRRKVLQKLLDERMEEISRERKDRGQGFLGLPQVLDQVVGSEPQEVSRSPRPSCYTKCVKVFREFKERERERRERYSFASLLYRLGLPNFKFPENTYLPPKHRTPRVLPFQHMEVADLQC